MKVRGVEGNAVIELKANAPVGFPEAYRKWLGVFLDEGLVRICPEPSNVDVLREIQELRREIKGGGMATTAGLSGRVGRDLTQQSGTSIPPSEAKQQGEPTRISPKRRRRRREIGDNQVFLKPHETAALLGIHRATLASKVRHEPGFPLPENHGPGLQRVYDREKVLAWKNRATE